MTGFFFFASIYFGYSDTAERNKRAEENLGNEQKYIHKKIINVSDSVCGCREKQFTEPIAGSRLIGGVLWVFCVLRAAAQEERDKSISWFFMLVDVLVISVACERRFLGLIGYALVSWSFLKTFEYVVRMNYGQIIFYQINTHLTFYLNPHYANRDFHRPASSSPLWPKPWRRSLVFWFWLL